MKHLAKRITALIPLAFIERYLLWKFGYRLLSFSLSGEDIILHNLLRKTKNGFYVDVGAHHPTHFSNTYLFYREGWRGINIDATPGKIDLFRAQRPRDINIESAVSNTEGHIEFFLFDKSALNTGSPEMASEEERLGYPVREKITVPTRTLSGILNEHLQSGQKIDFMSVDVEGADMDVLASNDWIKYSPTVIAVEDCTFDPEHPEKSEAYNFLKEMGYKLVAYMGTTLIVKRTRV